MPSNVIVQRWINITISANVLYIIRIIYKYMKIYKKINKNNNNIWKYIRKYWIIVMTIFASIYYRVLFAQKSACEIGRSLSNSMWTR